MLPVSVFADSSLSTVIMDSDSGRILYEHNMNDKRLIASTTKIMTCIITLENVDMDNTVTVGEEVIDAYGTNIYIEVGEKISIKDLLYGLMLRSGNDAALVLSHNVFKSYDEFIKKMNEKAKDIGMNDTNFENPHGLDEETRNYSTAHDMALLAKYAYSNKVYRNIISTKKYMAKTDKKTYDWYNRMSLINTYKYCVGGKNGYTPSAGKTLVSYAKYNGANMLIVTLGDSDIYNNHKILYKRYFKKYKSYKIIDKNQFRIDSTLVDGEVYIKKSFSYLLQDNEIDDISTLVQINNKINKNKVGEVIIKLDDKEIGRVNIYRRNQKKKNSLNILPKIRQLFV